MIQTRDFGNKMYYDNQRVYLKKYITCDEFCTYRFSKKWIKLKLLRRTLGN